MKASGGAAEGRLRRASGGRSSDTFLRAIDLPGDCNQAVAARDFAAVRADIEPDNDHTDTPTTMSIDGFFFLIRHPGPRLMARSTPNCSGSGAGSSSVKLYSEKFGAAPSRNSSHFSLVFTVRNSRSSMVPRITG